MIDNTVTPPVNESERASSARSGVVIGNLREPIVIANVKMSGVSAESVQGAGTIKVWTRLALTSDEAYFHRVVESLIGVLRSALRSQNKYINFDASNDVLLIIRSDETAQLWVDSAAVAINILAKRSIEAGTAVFEKDIADIVGLDFPCVELGPKDKLVYLFRQDWRFGLFFDFNPDGSLSREETVRDLGTLYRRLKFRHLYDLIADQKTFDRLIEAGWFPFVDIIGAEFKGLASACEAGFHLAEAEEKVLKSYEGERLDRMFDRWMSKPAFKSKELILRSAIRAYKADDPVAVLKIVLTEIEGVLSDAHFAKKGSRPKIHKLLEFARMSAEQKSGARDTLLFPADFARYLQRYTFATFNPNEGTGTGGHRHAVGHGIAAAESYTKGRALQAILTLDQLAFYI